MHSIDMIFAPLFFVVVAIPMSSAFIRELYQLNMNKRFRMPNNNHCHKITSHHSSSPTHNNLFSEAIHNDESNRISYLPNQSTHDHNNNDLSSSNNSNKKEKEKENIKKLESKLMKKLRTTSLKYNMIQNNDHIMCCISGGKDSATLLHLLLQLQSRLKPHMNFNITAVHLNQMQPNYNNTSLVSWLENELRVPYLIVDEDTYSIVKDKTPEGKTYCSLCSRLRRGVLYTVARDIGATKLALGHHGDDAIETLLLNAIHQGQLKAMPARYYSSTRSMHVIRPLMDCLEVDIREFAEGMAFPILPCNLCGSQPNGQRKRVKMLCDALEVLNPNAKKNMIRAMGDVRPSHLLDVGLREACGLDGVTGRVLEERARLVRGYEEEDVVDDSELLW